MLLENVVYGAREEIKTIAKTGPQEIGMVKTWPNLGIQEAFFFGNN